MNAIQDILMYAWYRRLPLTVRLPAAVAVMIFIVGVGTTQAVIYVLSLQFERQMSQVAEVYLDGLSAALLPSVQANDQAGMEQIFDRAFKIHVGIAERHLLCLNSSGEVIAQATRNDVSAPEKLPANLSRQASGVFFDHADHSVWAWRELRPQNNLEAEKTAVRTVITNLDLSKFIEEHTAIQWFLIGLNVLLSGLCALFGFFLAKQLQRPVVLLTEHLENGPQPVPAGKIPVDDPRISQLIQAFNKMVSKAHEREAMLSQLAEQERVAVLGRMAATLAHEVRNPLGGVLTALNTLRKFGDNPSTREESIDFMERGLLTIQEVANATLKTYRPSALSRSFGAEDLLDIQRMAEIEAKRRGVVIHVDSQLPESVQISATEVRQMLLNLLLNATQVTEQGGIVTLRGRILENELLLEVIDQGTGLQPEIAQGLEHGKSLSGHNGLGVDVIVRLMEQLQGRTSVTANANGTHISLYLPISEHTVSDYG